MKSHEGALLDLWRFQSSGDESGLRNGGILLPLAIRGLKLIMASLACVGIAKNAIHYQSSQ